MDTLRNKDNDNNYFTIQTSIAIYFPYLFLFYWNPGADWSLVHCTRINDRSFSWDKHWAPCFQQIELEKWVTLPFSSVPLLLTQLCFTFILILNWRLERLWSKAVYLLNIFCVSFLVHWAAAVKIIYEIDIRR